jgi:hypothetical protein
MELLAEVSGCRGATRKSNKTHAPGLASASASVFFGPPRIERPGAAGVRVRKRHSCGETSGDGRAVAE